MAFNPQRHRRWLLASRPHGEPTGENFRLEEGDVAEVRRRSIKVLDRVGSTVERPARDSELSADAAEKGPM